MRKKEKIIMAVLPNQLVEKIGEIPYYPNTFLSSDNRIRSMNCRYLLSKSLDRHIDAETGRLKEPLDCAYQLADCDTKIGFIIPDSFNQTLEDLKKYYVIPKKTLTSLLICQEAKRQEEGWDDN